MSDRDLDANIAEYIFGWKEIKVPPDANGYNECIILTPNGSLKDFSPYALPVKGKLHRAFLVPPYTGDIQWALILAQKINFNKPLCEIPIEPFLLAKICWDFWLETSDEEAFSVTEVMERAKSKYIVKQLMEDKAKAK